LFQLDAKKSPLALLAQTCSAIGKEPITIAKPLSQQNKLFRSNDTLNPLNNLFRKTSAVCASSSSSLPRKTASSPALSEGKAEHFRREKSPPNSKASYIANWRTFSQMVKYGDLVKFNSPKIDRKKNAEVDSRKRKSLAQREISERKISKLDNAHGSPKLSSSPAISGTSATNLYNQSLTEQQRSEHKISHPLTSLYDSYCLGCQIPHAGGPNNCIDSLKAISLPFHPFANPSANPYPLYAQMLMSGSRNSAPSLDSSPFVCNWVNPGSGTCGKRFISAEELSNHLKTHVSSTPNNSGLNYFMNSLKKLASTPYAAAYLSHAAALAAATPGSSAISSNLLSRSHSPLNGYPYKAHMLSQFTNANTLPSLPIAAAGPYSTPYGIHYTQKLNPAVTGFGFPI